MTSRTASGYRILLKDASLLSEYLIALHNSHVYLGQPAGCEASALFSCFDIFEV